MAKQQSLAELSAGHAIDVVVDDFGPMVITSSRVLGPYVVFTQPKATDQWTSLVTKLPGLQDGDQVLVYPEPAPPVRLQPMRFTMLACQQYWVQKDQAGNPVGKPSKEQKPRADRWNEEVLAACIVYAGDMAVPASCTFKTVKCQAAITLKLQIEEAAKPEWAEQSAAHKAAFGAFSKPFLRVVAAVTTTKRTGGGGFSYVQARSVVAPATPNEYSAMKRLMDEGGLDKLKALSEHYHSRLKEMGVE